MKTGRYEIITFSELELQRYDVHQIRMLQNSVITGDVNTLSVTSTVLNIEENENKPLKLEKKMKNDLEKFGTSKEKFTAVGTISVFSAYYDNRATLDYPLGLVRVIGLTGIDSRENLVCGFLESVMGPWILAEKYEMCENHGKLYGGYMFNCMIAEHMKIIPKKVYLQSLTSISEQTKLNVNISVELEVISIMQSKSKIKEQDMNTDRISMTQPEATEHKNKSSIYSKISVCLSPMYGKINLSNFIQFIELLKIQGVNHFIIYKMSISKSVQILLDYYQSKGEMTVVNWTLPSFAQTQNIWYNGQIIMIQDCLYRTMGSFDFVAFLDLDEAIIPRSDFSWPAFLQDLETKARLEYPDNEIVGFSFKSAYFDPNNQTTDSQKLSFLKTLHRNRILSERRTKVIVKPEVVIEMGIHHLSKTVSDHNLVYDVDPDVGLIHHFKGCTTQLDPQMKCDQSTEDKSILKYEKMLSKQYNDVLKYNMKYFKTLSWN